MRILCLGGSFNPIHHGHLVIARAAAEMAGFDQVRLIPNLAPPHKPDAPLAPAADRLAMARLAAAADPLFCVDDVELHRPPPSYTIDTMRQFRAAGLPRMTWLIGADTLPTLHTWRQADELLREADFLVVPRPGHPIDPACVAEPFRRLAHAIVAAPHLEISSTDIRRRVAASRSIEYLTPPTVVAYILSHHLYRPPAPADQPNSDAGG
jgi:nicotinate-nucleotide adenylyltransferase